MEFEMAYDVPYIVVSDVPYIVVYDVAYDVALQTWHSLLFFLKSIFLLSNMHLSLLRDIKLLAPWHLL